MEIHQIYIIRNRINGKVYIGATTREYTKRLKDHKNAARHHLIQGKPLSPFYSDMIHFGIESFTIHLLDKCPGRREMYQAERGWIYRFRAAGQQVYNIKP